MSKIYWFLNLAMLVSAAVATSWLSGQDPEQRWDTRSAQLLQTTADGPKTVVDTGSMRAAMPPIGLGAIDDLWKRSLFRPDRTEDIGASEEVKKEAAAEEFTLELVGIGRIGDKAAAIIRDTKQRVARPTRRTTRTARARTAVARAAQAAQAAAESERKPTPVYVVGDEVGATGWVVKQISFDEVIVERNGEEKPLRLDFEDTDSIARNTTAAKEDEKDEADSEADKPEKEEEPARIAVGGTIETPPPPPPPPPVAVLPAGAARAAVPTREPAEMSRAERLKRRQEIRERVLKARREGRQQQ